MKLSLLTSFAALLQGAHSLAPFIKLDSSAKAVPNSYIVVLKDNVSDTAFSSHLKWADGILKTSSDAGRKFTYNAGGFKGYNIRLPEAAAKLLAASDDIAYIEPDAALSLPPTPQIPTKTRRNVQTAAPWNLARISHRRRTSTDYVYTPTTGTSVYVIDTGLMTSHQAFGGRAIFGYNAVGGSNTDANGHGTFVGGIASSDKYGVARYATVIGVKALEDSGSTTISTLISAINWCVTDMQTRGGGRVNKSAALLAVGGGFSASLNQAVASGSTNGLFFAVAAGGSNTNAGQTSPASEPSACTVGGTTIDDARASWSNYGAVIDIFAPGQNIIGPWITSSTATNTISGTSAATAHIAGLGAYFLGVEGPRTPAALCQRIKDVATSNVLTGIPSGTVNLLAYNNSGL
jgi:hypothetical protein